MGSIVYLALGVMFGYAVCELLFPGLKTIGEKTFGGKALSLSSYLLRIPAWVLAGVIPLTWSTYLTAYVLAVVFGNENPLFTADMIVMGLFAVLTALLLYLRYRKGKKEQCPAEASRWFHTGEWIFFGCLLVFFTQLTSTTIPGHWFSTMTTE